MRELQIRKYLQSLFNHLDLSSSRVIFQFYPKKLVIHSFIMDVKSQKMKWSSTSPRKTFLDEKKKIFLGGANQPFYEANEKSLILFLKHTLFTNAFSNQKNESAYLFLHLFKRLLLNTKVNSLVKSSNLEYQLPLQLTSRGHGFRKSSLQDEILQIYPHKISNKYTSANFVAEFIARSLESNMSFREIFRSIQREIQSSGIRGLRIMCSGRLGGAEMAKVESRKFGQTSLQTFSLQVDFAHAEAYTLYGIIGVKVWLVSENSHFFEK